MDIQVSSNFERLLFDAMGRDAAGVRRLMQSLAQGRSFTTPEAALGEIRKEFDAGRASEVEVAEEMRRVLAEAGYLLDPHTAVGHAVARRHEGTAPMVVLATAHPAKFPDAIEAATASGRPCRRACRSL